MSTTSTILDTALAYHEHGYRPVVCCDSSHPPGKCIVPRKIPCGSPGKAPIHASWQSERLTRERLKNLLLKHPGANIGIRWGEQSGLIDVECDTPDAEQSLRELLGEARFPELVLIPTYRSRRGLHRLFRYTTGLPKAVVKLFGVEFRCGGNGRGSQSLVPPSRHHTGAKYEWLEFLSLDDVEIEQVKRTDDWVEGMIPRNSLVVAFGQPGDGKSFFSLAMCMSHATGDPLFGHEIKRELPIYVAAEGSAGLGIRLAAWKMFHNKPGKAGVSFLTEPVQFMQFADVDRFLTAAEQLPEPPSLIVVDTLARCLIGGDENSSKDVGLFIAGADRVRKKLGSTVLIVHHTTKDGATKRGSSALRGAADAMIQFERDGEIIVVKCAKMKDGAPFGPLYLRFTEVTIDDEKSCVLESTDPTTNKCMDAPALEVLKNAFDGPVESGDV